MKRLGGRKEPSQAEQDLLDRLGPGDTGAFEALCADVEAPLFTYVLKLVGDASEAEEIAQEALFRLYRAWRARRIEKTPRAYLFSIAHNLALDGRRKVHNQQRFRSGLVVPKQPVASAATTWRAEQALLREQIDKALALLPDSHRSALMLREFGDLRYEEIAETLGASVEQVKVWIYRARKRLAELLDRDGQYVGDKQDGA